MKYTDIKKENIRSTEDFVKALLKDGPIFNPKIPYPIKDFLKDLEMIPRYLEGNVYDMPINFTVKEGRKEYSVKFDTTWDFYRIGQYFSEKYKDIHIASTRQMKFSNITDFISINLPDLSKYGLYTELGIRIDFIEYLLEYQMISITKNIPIKVIKDFIRKK